MKQYVDMRGVIEVRTVYDDPDQEQGHPEDRPIDMFHFQEDVEYVPGRVASEYSRIYSDIQIFPLP